MKKSIIITAIALCFSITALNAKTDVNLLNNSEIEFVTKINPFCMAIVKGDLETVQKMIALGADINEKSIGLTPAMYAAKFNKVDILKILISRGANLKAKSDVGYTAKKYAELSNALDAKTVLENALIKIARV